MHELGIVMHIIRTIEEVAADNALTSVSAVTLEVGEVSGVVPRYLTDAWRWAADKRDMLRGSELVVEMEPAITLCESCHERYATLRFGRVCPVCGSSRTYLVCGREVSIRDITVLDT